MVISSLHVGEPWAARVMAASAFFTAEPSESSQSILTRTSFKLTRFVRPRSGLAWTTDLASHRRRSFQSFGMAPLSNFSSVTVTSPLSYQNSSRLVNPWLPMTSPLDALTRSLRKISAGRPLRILRSPSCTVAIPISRQARSLASAIFVGSRGK